VNGSDRPDEPVDLDDELRRLFADDRLAVPVADGAEHAVVAGARRRRKHRMAVAAAGGVLAVTGLLFAGVALTGVGRPGGTVSAAAPVLSATLTTSPDPTTPAQVPDQLGPYGTEGIVLGMSLGETLQAKRHGDVVMTGPLTKSGALAQADAERTGKCLVYQVISPYRYGASAVPTTRETPAPPGTDVEQKPVTFTVLVSLRGGVFEVGGATVLRTPEGLGVGSTVKDVVGTYGPPLKKQTDADSVVVGVPDNTDADYVFDLSDDGLVTAVWLHSVQDPDC
jgi:hypothetical protein